MRNVESFQETPDHGHTVIVGPGTHVPIRAIQNHIGHLFNNRELLAGLDVQHMGLQMPPAVRQMAHRGRNPQLPEGW